MAEKRQAHVVEIHRCIDVFIDLRFRQLEKLSLEKQGQQKQKGKQREEADANAQRRRTSVFFYVGLATTVIVGGICLYAALSSDFTTDQQRFAGSIVTLLIGGVAGFLTGKNAK